MGRDSTPPPVSRWRRYSTVPLMRHVGSEKMRHILVVILVLSAAPVFARRTPAPRVPAVEHAGVRYVAPNTSGRVAYVEARDVQTGAELWRTPVFTNRIDPSLEEDVQWIFIKRLDVIDGTLVVIDERDRKYLVDLKTSRVQRSRIPWLFYAGGLVLVILVMGMAVWLSRRRKAANKALPSSGSSPDAPPEVPEG